MPPRRSVDLNADVGEAVDDDGLAVERSLLSFVTSVHVACGGHAGDQGTMSATVDAALRQGVRIGAHPSYPDRDGFGRRPLTIAPLALADSLAAQVTALAEVCRGRGTRLSSVKAHGALYGEVAKGESAFDVLRQVTARCLGPATTLVLPAGSAALAQAQADGAPVLAEGFCDRAYNLDGTLVDRGVDGALLSEPAQAARQAVALVRDGVVGTLCIHGDSPGAVALAEAVRAALHAEGIAVQRSRAAPSVTLGPNSVEVGVVRPFGDCALMVETADGATARSLAQALVRALQEWVDEGACEVIGGLASVVVRASDVHVADELRPVVHEVVRTHVDAPDEADGEGTVHTIPCAFDGPDLDDAAAAAGCTPAEVVAHCTAQSLRVAMLGFSPGFAFLDGLPEVLRRVPRRDRPRPVVPAGSVALANGHAAVYPSASPGGWHPRSAGLTSPLLFSPVAALVRAPAGRGHRSLHRGRERCGGRGGAVGRAALGAHHQDAPPLHRGHPRLAQRAAGRRAPRRGVDGRAGGWSGRSARLRAGQPAGGQRR